MRSFRCSLEELMLKLKLQYFGHLMQRVDSLEKTMMLGPIGGRRGRDDREWDGWMASLTLWTLVWVNSRNLWWTGRPAVLDSWGRKESDMTERLKNWTELRLPCPPPSPRGCLSSCPLHHWCHPSISSSVSFSFCLQSFPASGSFPMSWLFTTGGQILEL